MNPTGKIDLLLGGDLAHWFLDHIDARSIGNVFTLDEHLAKRARTMGATVLIHNANAVTFTPNSIALSIHYPRILKPHFIEQYDKIYNIHPGFLPNGRGFYPVFWALWENTPAGATLHEISAGIDEGAIVEQVRVEYTDADTGGSLHARVHAAEQDLLLRYRDALVQGEMPAAYPQQGAGTYHARHEFFDLKQHAAWQTMSSDQLVKLARCLSFPGYSGLEIEQGGGRFQMRVDPLPDHA